MIVIIAMMACNLELLFAVSEAREGGDEELNPVGNRTLSGSEGGW